jgi:hypothetical protein
VIEFDTSGITQPILGAKLQLYAVDNSHNVTPFAQEAYLVTPNGIDASTTWNSYYSGGFAEDKLESFGYYSLPADSAVAQYYDSQLASAADLAKIAAARGAGSGKLTFSLKAAPYSTTTEQVLRGRREWADLEAYVHPSDSMTRPAKLIINGGQTVLTVRDDTFLHERDADVDRQNDWISAWSHESNGDPLQRWGLMQFDLSSLTEPITSAVLQTFAIDTATAGAANAEPFEQEAYLTNVTGFASGLTWNSYASGGYTETPMEQLGHYFFEADTENDQYFDSDAASAGDVAALETIRQNAWIEGGIATFLLKAAPIYIEEEVVLGGEREWGDIDFFPDQPPKLVLTVADAAVLYGDANNDGIVDDKDASIVGANWLASDVGFGGGDFNSDGIVNDKDAAILAAHWGQSAEGGPAVPEPGTLTLLAVGLMSLLAIRRKSAV